MKKGLRMILTCLILNYNDSDTTINLVKKISNYKAIDKILIVDNKSTDDSFNCLKEIEKDNIKVISSDRNGGYGYGNNFGIEYAIKQFRTTHILISNPDVYFTEETVIALKDAFSRCKDCAIIAPVQVKYGKIFSWKLASNLKIVLSSSMIVSKIFGEKLTHYKDDYFKNKRECFVDIVSGSLLMINAEIMKRYGMYDEDMFLYFEEVVLAHKFKESGYKSKLLINEIYQHNHSTSVRKSIKSIVKTKKMLLDNELIFFTKYRKTNALSITLIKIFFKLSISEMVMYSLYNNIKSIINMKKRKGELL
jgi:GT2 family glycosyltransferase